MVYFLSIASIGVFRNSFAIFETGTAIYICYGPAQAARTTSTLLQFMAAPTLFAPLNHASTPPRWKRSPPDTFKSRTPDATRKLQLVVSSIATPVNLIVIEVLVIVQVEPDGWISQ